MTAPRVTAAPVLQREMFSVSRASEYFDARELQAQTGQPRHRFAAFAVKELADNGLDACEAAGVAPEIDIAIRRKGERLVITVQDNAAGIEAETVAPDPGLRHPDQRQGRLSLADAGRPGQRPQGHHRHPARARRADADRHPGARRPPS